MTTYVATMPTVCHRPVAAAVNPEPTSNSVPTTWAVRDRNAPGGDRAVALDGVQAVGLDVEHVVPQVQPARRQAERHEREHRLAELWPVVEHAGGAGRGEHEQVLAPLQRTGRLQQARRQRRAGRARFVVVHHLVDDHVTHTP